MSNLNLQKLCEWVWPWPWTFNSNLGPIFHRFLYMANLHYYCYYYDYYGCCCCCCFCKISIIYVNRRL